MTTRRHREAPDAKYFYHWFELVDYDSEPFQNMLRMVVTKRIHLIRDRPCVDVCRKTC